MGQYHGYIRMTPSVLMCGEYCVYVLLEYLVFTVKLYNSDGCVDCDRYTSGGNVTGETSTVYAVLLDWPSNSSVLLGALSSHHVTSVEMLGLTGTRAVQHCTCRNRIFRDMCLVCVWLYLLW